MFHAGVALLALLVPSVLPCGHVGLRAGILPKNAEDHFVHVHVVVFGKVYCAPTYDYREITRPLKVTLDLGHRIVTPSDYQLLSNKTFGIGTGDLDFALSGDYSYSPVVECTPGQPRVTVEDFCGQKVLDDIKPVYEGQLGGKNQLLKVYDLGQIRPADGRHNH